jgi:hypothetical protein
MLRGNTHVVAVATPGLAWAATAAGRSGTAARDAHLANNPDTPPHTCKTSIRIKYHGYWNCLSGWMHAPNCQEGIGSYQQRPPLRLVERQFLGLCAVYSRLLSTYDVLHLSSHVQCQRLAGSATCNSGSCRDLAVLSRGILLPGRQLQTSTRVFKVAGGPHTFFMGPCRTQSQQWCCTNDA